jgi:UDP-N-acetylmuramoyl-L-alanyl-D-glutamate--2,6-diaminopimelate ligase
VSSAQPSITQFPNADAITSVTHDSRRVTTGSLFCCVRGASSDGHTFAAQAVRDGAVALLVDHRLDGINVPQLAVEDVREAMGSLAAEVYGNPSRAMDVIGVTGTNGKTTTTWIIKHVLDQLQQPCGLVGTLTGAFTTPEAPDLQARLAGFRDAGDRAVAMEVSSHALALGRANGTWFRVGVFTNLTQDHLDLHGTMDAYEAAKARLFEPERCERAVVNRDDDAGTRLLERLGDRATSFGAADARDPDVGVRYVEFLWRGVSVRIGMGGWFTVLNALAALTTVAELGYGTEAIAAAMATVPPVPGRFEPIDAGQPFGVVVDYAHTPDGLRAVLEAARPLTRNRLIVVFGCGGDRDAGKRPKMGAMAAERADQIVVTSDNPRSEVPAAIISDVLSGLTPAQSSRALVEPDRRVAIALAFATAQPGDVIVIAGKGHEATQTIGNKVLPFDDRAVARELLEAMSS